MVEPPKTLRGEIAKLRLDLAEAREQRDMFMADNRELRSRVAILEREYKFQVRLKKALAREARELLYAVDYGRVPDPEALERALEEAEHEPDN